MYEQSSVRVTEAINPAVIGCPLLSVRHAVTFPAAAEHHCTLAAAKLCCLVKIQVRTLNIAPLRESPPQKSSGRLFRMFSRDLAVLPVHPHVHSQSEWAIPAFAFTAIAGTHLPTPEGWKAE